MLDNLLDTLFEEYGLTKSKRKPEPESYSDPVQSSELKPGEVLSRLGYECIFVTDPDTAHKVVDQLLTSRVIGLDIETAPLTEFFGDERAGLDPHKSKIRTIQLCNDSRVFVFDLDRVPLEVFSPVWSCPLVAHNATFEAKNLMHKGVVPDRLGCTLLLEILLNGGQYYSLQALTAKYLGFTPSKETRLSDWAVKDLDRTQIEYAGMDAALALKLFCALNTEITRQGLTGIASIVAKAITPAASMELAGIPFDTETHRELMRGWEIEHAALEAELLDLFCVDTMSQKKKITEWFGRYSDKNKLGLKKGKSGMISISKDSLSAHVGDPIIQKYLRYSAVCKNISSFGETFTEKINPVTGRIHAQVKLCGTSTGRITTSNPSLQQFPAGEFRTVIKPSQGRVIISADYSQIELRLCAIIANEENMLSAYRNREDLHRKTASMVTGVPPENVTKPQRQVAKALNFGLLYGQGVGGLRHSAMKNYGVDLTYNEARKYREGFFKAYPSICAYHRRMNGELAMSGVIRTVDGWKRDFKKEASNLINARKADLAQLLKDLDRALAHKEKDEGILERKLCKKTISESTKDQIVKKECAISNKQAAIDRITAECKELERKIYLAERCTDIQQVAELMKRDKVRNFRFESYNTPIQGLGASLIMRALHLTFQSLKGTSGRLINAVHDEILVECAEKEADQVRGVVIACMNQAFTDIFPNHAYMTADLVEANIGRSWADTK